MACWDQNWPAARPDSEHEPQSESAGCVEEAASGNDCAFISSAEAAEALPDAEAGLFSQPEGEALVLAAAARLLEAAGACAAGGGPVSPPAEGSRCCRALCAATNLLARVAELRPGLLAAALGPPAARRLPALLAAAPPGGALATCLLGLYTISVLDPALLPVVVEPDDLEALSRLGLFVRAHLALRSADAELQHGAINLLTALWERVPAAAQAYAGDLSLVEAMLEAGSATEAASVREASAECLIRLLEGQAHHLPEHLARGAAALAARVVADKLGAGVAPGTEDLAQEPEEWRAAGPQSPPPPPRGGCCRQRARSLDEARGAEEVCPTCFEELLRSSAAPASRKAALARALARSAARADGVGEAVLRPSLLDAVLSSVAELDAQPAGGQQEAPGPPAAAREQRLLARALSGLLCVCAAGGGAASVAAALRLAGTAARLGLGPQAAAGDLSFILAAEVAEALPEAEVGFFHFPEAEALALAAATRLLEAASAVGDSPPPMEGTPACRALCAAAGLLARAAELRPELLATALGASAAHRLPALLAAAPPGGALATCLLGLYTISVLDPALLPVLVEPGDAEALAQLGQCLRAHLMLRRDSELQHGAINLLMALCERVPAAAHAYTGDESLVEWLLEACRASEAASVREASAECLLRLFEGPAGLPPQRAIGAAGLATRVVAERLDWAAGGPGEPTDPPERWCVSVMAAVPVLLRRAGPHLPGPAVESQVLVQLLRGARAGWRPAGLGSSAAAASALPCEGGAVPSQGARTADCVAGELAAVVRAATECCRLGLWSWEAPAGPELASELQKLCALASALPSGRGRASAELRRACCSALQEVLSWRAGAATDAAAISMPAGAHLWWLSSEGFLQAALTLVQGSDWAAADAGMLESVSAMAADLLWGTVDPPSGVLHGEPQPPPAGPRESQGAVERRGPRLLGTWLHLADAVRPLKDMFFEGGGSCAPSGGLLRAPLASLMAAAHLPRLAGQEEATLMGFRSRLLLPLPALRAASEALLQEGLLDAALRLDPALSPAALALAAALADSAAEGPAGGAAAAALGAAVRRAAAASGMEDAAPAAPAAPARALLLIACAVSRLAAGDGAAGEARVALRLLRALGPALSHTAAAEWAVWPTRLGAARAAGALGWLLARVQASDVQGVDVSPGEQVLLGCIRLEAAASAAAPGPPGHELLLAALPSASWAVEAARRAVARGAAADLRPLFDFLRALTAHDRSALALLAHHRVFPAVAARLRAAGGAAAVVLPCAAFATELALAADDGVALADLAGLVDAVRGCGQGLRHAELGPCLERLLLSLASLQAAADGALVGSEQLHTLRQALALALPPNPSAAAGGLPREQEAAAEAAFLLLAVTSAAGVVPGGGAAPPSEALALLSEGGVAALLAAALDRPPSSGPRRAAALALAAAALRGDREVARCLPFARLPKALLTAIGGLLDVGGGDGRLQDASCLLVVALLSVTEYPLRGRIFLFNTLGASCQQLAIARLLQGFERCDGARSECPDGAAELPSVPLLVYLWLLAESRPQWFEAGPVLESLAELTERAMTSASPLHRLAFLRLATALLSGPPAGLLESRREGEARAALGTLLGDASQLGAALSEAVASAAPHAICRGRGVTEVARPLFDRTVTSLCSALLFGSGPQSCKGEALAAQHLQVFLPAAKRSRGLDLGPTTVGVAAA